MKIVRAQDQRYADFSPNNLPQFYSNPANRVGDFKNAPAGTPPVRVGYFEFFWLHLLR